MDTGSSVLSSEIVLIAAYVLAMASAFIVAKLIFTEEAARAAEEGLESNRRSLNPLVNITRPFFTRYVVPMVRGKKVWDNQRKDYRRKLITAGLKDELTPDEFIAFKFFQILFFPLMCGVLRSLEVFTLGDGYIALSAILGWFYPDIWINSIIKKRHMQIRMAMPFIVDLLALSTEAGLDIVGAISKVVEKAKPSPLVQEFEQMLKEIKVGSSRADAMREMALRINLLEVNSFVAILVSAEAMGASIGEVLKQQSETIRLDRFVRAEKEGAKSGVMLIGVTVLVILPAVILMVMGPFVVGFLTGNLGSI